MSNSGRLSIMVKHFSSALGVRFNVFGSPALVLMYRTILVVPRRREVRKIKRTLFFFLKSLSGPITGAGDVNKEVTNATETRTTYI